MRRRAGKGAVRDRDHQHPRGLCRPDPACRVFDCRGAGRIDLEPARRFEVDVRRRFPSLHVLRGHRHPKKRCEPGKFERAVDQFAVGRRGEPQRPAPRHPHHRFLCAVDQRQVLCVAIEHPAHDLALDLFGRLRKPQLLVHVPRPFGGAHSHHVRLGALVPVAAALARELLADFVPELLGVDQHAVQVEDDGLDLSRQGPVVVYTRPSASQTDT